MIMSVPVDETTELKELWNKGEPFLMQMEVSAPYDGCWVEPNLFLVTPPGSSLHDTLMANIPSRYGPVRERTAEANEKARGKACSAQYEFDRLFRDARGPRFSWQDKPTAEEAALAFDAMHIREMKAEEVYDRFALAVLEDLTPMEQPPLYVWPLYASGQGRAMDCVHSLEELVHVCSSESVYELANRSTWPDGLAGSQFATGIKAHGRITLVAVSAMGPVNTSLPAGERYWMAALSAADRHWGVSLQWECAGCGSIIEYDEYEGRPEPTGYSGDGGIGVHYHDVLCSDCLLKGACDCCRESSGDPMEYYSRDIAEYGWSLCEYCTERLLEDCDLAGEVDDLPSTVELQWWKDEQQTELPGMEAPSKLVFVVEGSPVKGLQFDASALASTASDMRIEHLNPEYGYGGVALSGTVVENVAFKRV
jgi:hypothetical protein